MEIKTSQYAKINIADKIKILISTKLQCFIPFLRCIIIICWYFIMQSYNVVILIINCFHINFNVIIYYNYKLFRNIKIYYSRALFFIFAIMLND